MTTFSTTCFQKDKEFHGWKTIQSWLIVVFLTRNGVGILPSSIQDRHPPSSSPSSSPSSFFGLVERGHAIQNVWKLVCRVLRPSTIPKHLLYSTLPAALRLLLSILPRSNIGWEVVRLLRFRFWPKVDVWRSGQTAVTSRQQADSKRTMSGQRADKYFQEADKILTGQTKWFWGRQTFNGSGQICNVEKHSPLFIYAPLNFFVSFSLFWKFPQTDGGLTVSEGPVQRNASPDIISWLCHCKFMFFPKG